MAATKNDAVVCKKLDNFDFEQQKHSKFCYAAVLKAVLTIYKENITQEAICEAFTGETDKDVVQDVVHYLNGRRMFAYEQLLKGKPVPLDIVKAQINQGNPIIIYIDKGHYVLLYGYCDSNKRGFIAQYFIYDPNDPNKNFSIEYTSTYVKTEYTGEKEAGVPITGYYLVMKPTETHNTAKKGILKSVKAANAREAESIALKASKKSTKGGARKTRKSTHRKHRNTRKPKK